MCKEKVISTMRDNTRRIRFYHPPRVVNGPSPLDLDRWFVLPDPDVERFAGYLPPSYERGLRVAILEVIRPRMEREGLPLVAGSDDDGFCNLLLRVYNNTQKLGHCPKPHNAKEE